MTIGELAESLELAELDIIMGIDGISTAEIERRLARARAKATPAELARVLRLDECVTQRNLAQQAADAYARRAQEAYARAGYPYDAPGVWDSYQLKVWALRRTAEHRQHDIDVLMEQERYT